MRPFGFLSLARFWVTTWILVLFIGLRPLPPAVELVIVVGLVAHGVWFLQHRLRAIATGRALARAEDAEFRRRWRKRASGDNTERALGHPEAAAEPVHHGVTVGWSADGTGGRT